MVIERKVDHNWRLDHRHLGHRHLDHLDHRSFVHRHLDHRSLGFSYVVDIIVAKIGESFELGTCSRFEIDHATAEGLALDNSPAQRLSIFGAHRVEQLVLRDAIEVAELAIAHHLERSQQRWVGARAAPEPDSDDQQRDAKCGEAGGKQVYLAGAAGVVDRIGEQANQKRCG